MRYSVIKHLMYNEYTQILKQFILRGIACAFQTACYFWVPLRCKWAEASCRAGQLRLEHTAINPCSQSFPGCAQCSRGSEETPRRWLWCCLSWHQAQDNGGKRQLFVYISDRVYTWKLQPGDMALSSFTHLKLLLLLTQRGNKSLQWRFCYCFQRSASKPFLQCLRYHLSFSEKLVLAGTEII